MRISGTPRLLAIFLMALMLAPPLSSFPSDAGATWATSPKDFQNGTSTNVTSSSLGIQLPLNETYFNNWTRLDPWPSLRAWSSFAYDSKHGVFVLFGGFDMWGNELRATWTYNLSTNTWKNMTPADAPPLDSNGFGSNAHMVYDSKDDLFILCKWQTGLYYYDTWSYNLTANNWSRLNLNPAPHCAMGFMMCYDSANDLVVVSDGDGGGGMINETWTYRYGDTGWVKKTPSGKPEARTGAAAAYAPSIGEMVIFGGGNYVGEMNETWTYNCTTDKWTDKSPANAPPPRFGATMVYDTSNSRMLLFSGLNYSWTGFDDIWEYDIANNTWNELNQANKLPIVQGPAIAYDQMNRQTVLFGGISQYYWDETCSFDRSGNIWTKKNTIPCSRASHIMICDDRRNEVVVFGGLNETGYINDTWGYDPIDNVWYRKKATAPIAQYIYALDKENNVVIMVGRTADDTKFTYLYDLANDTMKFVGFSPFYVGEGSAMAYDSVNKVCVLWGGYNGNLTTTYDYRENKWTDKQPTVCPRIRSGGSMAFDEANGVTILFGGLCPIDSSYLNDTWAYNLTTDTWTQMNPSQRPGPRYNGDMVYYPAYGGSLLFGGLNWISSEICFNDTWVYNYSMDSWTRLNIPISPSRRTGAKMACDSNNGTMYMFGGGDNGLGWGETYAFNLNRFKSPGCHTSSQFDSRGSAYLGNITFKADVPANTSLAFQLRTANTSAELNQTAFIGPDGTRLSFYNSSGQRIAGINNGSRWIQYRAFFDTINAASTPVLRNVSINYNLMHNASLTSPAGGENWTGTHNIIWTGSDPDGDGLFVDIDLLDDISETQLAYGLAADDWSWSWDTMGTVNGKYRIRITVRDDNFSIPLSITVTSANFTIFHPRVNEAPRLSLVEPVDSAVFSSGEVRLNWTSDDLENDTLSYTVYLDTNSFPFISLPEPAITLSVPFYCTTLGNGTYYWTVVANDGLLNSSLTEEWRFTVAIPPPSNKPPAATLVSPLNGTTLNTTSVNLSWGGNDSDGDSIVYYLLVSSSPFNGLAHPDAIEITANTTYTLTNLTNGTTYYWAVIPWDGKENGTWSGLRSFTVDISKGNFPPNIPASSPPSALVNELWTFNVSGSDLDGDPLTYTLTNTPSGMTINSTTGIMTWTPTAPGIVTVTVNVTDPKGGYASRTFTVRAEWKVLPVSKPTGTITSVSNGSVVKSTFNLVGTATGTITRVEISIDNGTWVSATGTSSWSLPIDTKKLSNGGHYAKARVFDGGNNTEIASVYFTIDNPKAVPPVKSDNTMLYAVGAIAAIAVIGGMGAMAMRKKKPAEDEKPKDDNEAETDIEAETVTKTEPDEKPEEPEEKQVIEEREPKKKAAKKPVKTETDEVVAPAAEIAPVPAITSEPKPALAKTDKIAPEGFAVEDLFLMYNDGRLIMHQTRRLKADMDVDILTSMLKAVQEFVKESLGRDDNAELGAMEYGGSKIMMQKGKYVILAAVISGGEPAGFRDEMTGTIANIEGEFGPTLQSWDGVAAKLVGVKKFLGAIGAYKPAEASVQTTCKSNVSLKAELEFYQGFVRLKVAVKNDCDTFIADASFKLIYKNAVLRLDHIEPDYPQKGDDVILGNVEPREKKTIAFYLDPQICTESFLEGILNFKDARGNLEMLKLPRKLASVVCPIMYTDENVNTAMLKRMAVDELEKKDTKVFQIPVALNFQKAFDLAKAAVQHHDVRMVREYTQKDPYIGEAWYYGKAKGRDDKLVIRARVIAENKVLEFFVASGSTLMLTGMLAELKADLNRELETQKGKPELRQVTDVQKVDALSQITTLLEKDEKTK